MGHLCLTRQQRAGLWDGLRHREARHVGGEAQENLQFRVRAGLRRDDVRIRTEFPSADHVILI